MRITLEPVKKVAVPARLGLIAAVAFLLTGCGQSSIQVYSIPKEDAWKLPAGWQEREAGGMRAARFAAPSDLGPEIDVSIIPIRGFSGGQEAIINIWRQQMKLEPVQDGAATADSAAKVTIGSVDGHLYDLVSTENLIEDKARARSLIGVASKDGTSWYVKMTGDEAGVEKQKPVFVSFLKSINFNNIVPPSMPSMPAAGAGRESRGSGEGHEPGANPEWEVPSGWTEQPPTQMLDAKFVATGEGGARIDINVSKLSGDGGGLAGNVNRWRNQVGLGPWDEAELAKNVSNFDVAGGRASLVDFAGTDARSGQPARLIGVVVPMEGRTWFYKLMGDNQVAEREKPAFIKFVSSAKYPNG